MTIAIQIPKPLDYDSHELVKNGWIIFPISNDNEWKPIQDELYGGNLVDGFNFTQYQPAIVRRGFELSTYEGRYSSYQIMLAIFKHLNRPSYQTETLVVNDAIAPDVGTSMTRRMVMQSPPILKSPPFKNSQGELVCLGFTFRLMNWDPG